MNAEQVLVVKTAELRLSAKQYIEGEDIRSFLSKEGRYSFIDRAEAENNPAYKQLIPYATLTKAGFILVLERTSAQSETRLHGKLSLGVGGHINPNDEGASLDATIARALNRELNEELWLETPVQPRLLGLINDDSNSVGSVHLGLHYLVTVAERPLVRETDKMNANWLEPSQIEALRPRLETWSQILLPKLTKMVRL